MKNESVDLSIPGAVRVSIGDEGIVELKVLRRDVFRLTPKGPGETRLQAWTSQDELRQYTLSVRAP